MQSSESGLAGIYVILSK